MKLFFLLIVTFIWQEVLAFPLDHGSHPERFAVGKAKGSFQTQCFADSLPLPSLSDYRGKVQVVVAPAAKTFKKRSELLSTDRFYKAAVSYLQQQLGNQGYYLRDYEEALSLSKELEYTGKVRTQAEDLLIMGPSVDVFVNVAVSAITHARGEQQIQMEVKAIDKYTSKSYAVIPWRSSNKRFGALPSRHVKDVLDTDSVLIKFIDQFDQSIQEMLQRSEVIIESLDQKALPLNQNLLATGTLVDAIDQWMDQHADVRFSFVAGASRRLFRFQADKQARSSLNAFRLGSALQQHVENELKTNDIEFEEVGLRLVGKRIYIYIK